MRCLRRWSICTCPRSSDRAEKSSAEIIDILKLSPHRGRKWLHALHLAGLLDQVQAEPGSEADDTLPRSDPQGSSWARDPDVRYRLAPVLRSMFGADGYSGYFFREFLRYFRVADAYYLPNILRGEVIENPVRYPPVDSANTLLHDWMRSAALEALEVIRRHVNFRNRYERLLDVAGGDGTMALRLYKDCPNLNITVFNMPQPAGMVQERALQENAWDRITGFPGDFRTDPLPLGNDAVMFSRVLADWPPELCEELLQKAWRALLPGGQPSLCEPLLDHNYDLCLTWEHSYVPYDDFGLQCYKPLALYVRLLRETGFASWPCIHPTRPPSTASSSQSALTRPSRAPLAADSEAIAAADEAAAPESDKATVPESESEALADRDGESSQVPPPAMRRPTRPKPPPPLMRMMVTFGQVLQHVGHALDQVYRRRALLGDVDGDLAQAAAFPLGADDKLGGKQVFVNDAALHRTQQVFAPKGFQTVGIGAVEAYHHPQHAVDGQRRSAAQKRPAVIGPRHRLRAHHHLGLTRRQKPQRALIKVNMARVDLVADDKLAAGAQDASLHRRAIVGPSSESMRTCG